MAKIYSETTFLSVSPKMLLAVMVIASLEITGAFAATFTIKNNCAYTVWPGTLTSGQNQPQLSTTGFELTTGASQTVDSPAPWTGRFWARTGCTTQSGSLKCDTADCASGQAACNGAGATPPATLAEFTLASNGGQDFYDISLVDGFNLPLSITPQGGSNCQSASCSGNVNSVCPSELSVKVGGNTVACKSACLAFGSSEYCCTGDHSTSETCPATDYSKIFKNVCPQAYSYAYDDASSTFTCTGGANYLITFCP